jgi:hypothetical protein
VGSQSVSLFEPQRPESPLLHARLHTLSTIADWMIPRIGGSPSCLASCMTEAISSSEDTSHVFAATLTPFASNSEINVWLCRSLPPDREMERIYLAPRPAIHSIVARPRPPKPPTTAYVESDLSCASAGKGGMACSGVSISFVSRFLQILRAVAHDVFLP